MNFKVSLTLLLVAVLIAMLTVKGSSGHSESKESKEAKESKESKEAKESNESKKSKSKGSDNKCKKCDKPHHVEREVNISGCVGKIKDYVCDGACYSTSQYDPVTTAYSRDNMCCQPSDMEEKHTKLECEDGSEMKYDYTRPKKCYCGSCTDAIDRCEDGPTRHNITIGDIPVDIEDETGCSNMDYVPDVGLCTGQCVGHRCPQAQCMPTRLDGRMRFLPFMFECDSGLQGLTTIKNIGGCLCIPDELDDAGTVIPQCDRVRDRHNANTDSFMIDGVACTNTQRYDVYFCLGRCPPDSICEPTGTDYVPVTYQCGSDPTVTFSRESATSCACSVP